jgi:hypothetical protein
MQLQKSFRQRLATECRYAVTRMQQETQPARKLYYFSVFFGEAVRALNFEWDRDLALIQMVTQQAYNQINSQMPLLGMTIPIDARIVYNQLTQVAADLASYFEKTDDETTRMELYQILARLAEVAYVAGGNGAYLYEKGLIKF